MSKSRKDGRHKGGHKNTRNREVWSKRCKLVNGWDIHDADYKRITHKYERRNAKKEILNQLVE